MDIHTGIVSGVKSQGQDAKLLKTCKEFESIFLAHLMKTMRETVPESGLFDGGEGEKVFRDMRDEALAQEMAKAGGIGLGNALYKDLRAGIITEGR